MSAELNQEVLAEVEELTDEQLQQEAEKILAKREKQKAYRANQKLSPEAIEKRKAYRKAKYDREQAIIKKAKDLGMIE